MSRPNSGGRLNPADRQRRAQMRTYVREVQEVQETSKSYMPQILTFLIVFLALFVLALISVPLWIPVVTLFVGGGFTYAVLQGKNLSNIPSDLFAGQRKWKWDGYDWQTWDRR